MYLTTQSVSEQNRKQIMGILYVVYTIYDLIIHHAICYIKEILQQWDYSGILCFG